LPIALTAEQLALQASIREWAKRAGTIDAVRAQEPRHPAGPADDSDIASANAAGAAKDSDTGGTVGVGGPDAAAERWASLAELGVFGIGLPVASGGTGGRVAGLAAALAHLTESLVPGPLLRKLAGVAHRQDVAEAALELAGPAGATAADAALQEFLLSRCLSIAGGTTQILLSLVGERLLGLPRDEAR
jgi:3-oxochol-4-en-24-oyl-CoA dehydrogenase